MAGTALFIMFLSNPKRGVLSAYLAANPKGCINRLSLLWYPMIVAVPLVLAVLALFGYVHTAGTLMRSLAAELWLILGLGFTVAQQFSVCWLLADLESAAVDPRRGRRAACGTGESSPPGRSAAPGPGLAGCGA